MSKLSSILRPRIVELGKIKIGGKSLTAKTRSGHKLPEKYDYFVVTGLSRDENENLIPDAALMKSLSKHADHDGKIRRIPIALLSHDIEDCLAVQWVRYEGRHRAADSDGDKVRVWYDPDNKSHDHRKPETWYENPIVIQWEDDYSTWKRDDGSPVFRLHTTLSCVITAEGASWGGVYKFRTVSRISAEQLYGSLTQILRLTGGVLRGIPLRLRVRPMQVNPNGKIITVYVVHCEAIGDDQTQLQLMALQRLELEKRMTPQLEYEREEIRKISKSPETIEDDKHIADEYDPDTSDTVEGADTSLSPSDSDVAHPSAETPEAPPSLPPAVSPPPAVIPEDPRFVELKRISTIAKEAGMSVQERLDVWSKQCGTKITRMGEIPENMIKNCETALDVAISERRG